MYCKSCAQFSMMVPVRLNKKCPVKQIFSLSCSSHFTLDWHHTYRWALLHFSKSHNWHCIDFDRCPVKSFTYVSLMIAIWWEKMLFRLQGIFFVAVPQLATGAHLQHGWLAPPYPALMVPLLWYANVFRLILAHCQDKYIQIFLTTSL